MPARVPGSHVMSIIAIHYKAAKQTEAPQKRFELRALWRA